MGDTGNHLFPSGVAFVAGGSGGIGSAIARSLARDGADVVLTYNRNKDKAEAAADAVRELGRSAWILSLSLDDADAVKAAVDTTAEAHGGIHTVVYATGPFVHLKFMSKVEPSQFREYLLGDTQACYNLVHPSLPHLRKSKGSIVAVTTTAAARWANQDGLSAIPKSAVNALMRGIAREEGRFGVRANMVALGIIQAGMFNQTVEAGYIDERYLAAMAHNVPLQRLGQAEEVADAAAFLASARAGYTTGQVLHVDGGFSI